MSSAVRTRSSASVDGHVVVPSSSTAPALPHAGAWPGSHAPSADRATPLQAPLRALASLTRCIHARSLSRGATRPCLAGRCACADCRCSNDPRPPSRDACLDLLDLLHQLAREVAQVSKITRILRGHDESELMAAGLAACCERAGVGLIGIRPAASSADEYDRHHRCQTAGPAPVVPRAECQLGRIYPNDTPSARSMPQLAYAASACDRHPAASQGDRREWRSME